MQDRRRAQTTVRLVLPAERAACAGISQRAIGWRGVERDAPSVSRALPPVGWHSTDAHEPQMTTVCACEKTVVMAKQPARRMCQHGPDRAAARRAG
jgi:hypothetical protein